MLAENCISDGGVSDSIPVEFALEKHSKAVVVLTRPQEYRKEEMKGRKLFEIAFRKYPDFLDTLLNRNEAYNRTLDFCEAMEREGRIFILTPLPEFSVGRTEKKSGTKNSFVRSWVPTYEREIWRYETISRN